MRIILLSVFLSASACPAASRRAGGTSPDPPTLGALWGRMDCAGTTQDQPIVLQLEGSPIRGSYRGVGQVGGEEAEAVQFRLGLRIVPAQGTERWPMSIEPSDCDEMGRTHRCPQFTGATYAAAERSVRGRMQLADGGQSCAFDLVAVGRP